jgi:hypothetical protein
MPDTPAFREAFGQPNVPRPGCGVPVARLLGRFHAGTGVLLTRVVAPLLNAIKEVQAWAVCFYLKCQAKERGYVERPPQEGLPNVTVNIIEAISQARQRALERRRQHALSTGGLLQA